MKHKNKRILKKILLIVYLVILILIAYIMFAKKSTFADSGFGVSYDSGGSSSYSSSDDWDSYSDYNYDYNYNDHRPKASFEFVLKIIAFLIIVLIIDRIIISRMRNKNKTSRNTVIDDMLIDDKIKQYIPDFNKEEFLHNGYKIYCDIQNAWMNFKLEDVKDIITDELYNMYESQLTTLEVKGEQNIMKDFGLHRSYLKDVYKQNETITITTGYIIEFYDYIIEKTTGKVLRGTDKSKVRVTYEMNFRQTLDESKKVTKCPVCGADIEMNTSGVCEYCHAKLVTENTKWVLTEKKVINQEQI